MFVAGNERTDEDIFTVCNAHNCFSFIVGKQPTSHANFFVNDYRELLTIMEGLVGIKTAAPAADVPPLEFINSRISNNGAQPLPGSVGLPSSPSLPATP